MRRRSSSSAQECRLSSRLLSWAPGRTCRCSSGRASTMTGASHCENLATSGQRRLQRPSPRRCGLHVGDFGAYTAPGVVDSDRLLGFARLAVRRRRRWGCGFLPVALTNSLDLNRCGIGVEDTHLPPAVCTNVSVGTNRERTLQEEGRERESLKKKSHRKVQQKTLQAQNSGHVGYTRGEDSRRNMLFFACNCAAGGAERNAIRGSNTSSSFKNHKLRVGTEPNTIGVAKTISSPAESQR